MIEPFLWERVTHIVVGFLSHYLKAPLPYVCCHMTINKLLSESSHKTVFPRQSKTIMLDVVNLLLTFE